MEAASLFQKEETKQLHHNCIYSFLSEVLFSVYTSRSKCFLDVFKYFHTVWDQQNGTASLICHRFPSFCSSKPRCKLRFQPGSSSGFCFYQSQELWGLWRLVFQNFTVLFQVPRTHRAADNDSSPAVSETSRGLKRKIEKVHKLTHYVLLRESQLIWRNILIHICTHLYKKLKKSTNFRKTSHSCLMVPC